MVISKYTGLNDYTKYFGVFAKSVESKGEFVWDLRDLDVLFS